MPPVPNNIARQIKELCRLKHMMSNWESHPRGDAGPDDKGGFIEGMEVALQKNWPISPKRAEIIQRMYDKYVMLKPNEKQQQQPVPGDGNTFKLGEIEGVRASEGWRIKLNGTIIGSPTTREHAYIIALWLQNSLFAIEHYFLGKPDPRPVEEQVEQLQDATVEGVEADTKQAEEITEL